MIDSIKDFVVGGPISTDRKDMMFHTIKKEDEPIEDALSEGANFLMMLKYRSLTPEVMTTTTKNSERNIVLSSSSSSLSTSTTEEEVEVEEEEREEEKQEIPLAIPEDAFWLSDLQCYVRSHCCEFFAATDSDVRSFPTNASSSSKQIMKAQKGSGSGGRRGPVTLGRVGIRCVFCKDKSSRASQATSFPSQISGIYGAVVMMQCRHFPHCSHMPVYVRDILKKLKTGGSSSVPQAGQHQPGRQQYWAESARQLGLIDTPRGIRFASGKPNHLSGNKGLQKPTLSLAYSHAVAVTNDLSSSKNSTLSVINNHMTTSCSDQNGSYSYSPSLVEYQLQNSTNATPNDSTEQLPIDLSRKEVLDAIVGDSTLVTREDVQLVPEYLFVAMAQMKVCRLTEVDRVGCYKSRPLGFVGMACKHCGGQPGFGKFFPASVRSLAQTTTSQTMVKHISQKCRLCPPFLRQAVHSLLKEEEEKENNRPRYGSRKVFFQRVWARLHNESSIPPLPSTLTATSQHQLVTPNETDEDSSIVSSSDDTLSLMTDKRKLTLPTQLSQRRKKKQKL